MPIVAFILVVNFVKNKCLINYIQYFIKKLFSPLVIIIIFGFQLIGYLALNWWHGISATYSNRVYEQDMDRIDNFFVIIQ